MTKLDLTAAQEMLRNARIPIPHYLTADDLCVIACHFNPEGYTSRLLNFALFEQSLAQSGIAYFAVEAAFGESEHQLVGRENIHHVRAESLMWQKERLLNFALQRVPQRFTKIAWIDADVVFENYAWAAEASQLLEGFPVVQLFEEVVRLPRGLFQYQGVGEKCESFGSARSLLSNAALAGNFNFHGHTGFGWAARREVIAAHGLYDASIVGGGDDLMAHAFLGDFNAPCVTRHTGNSRPFTEHFLRWAERVHPLVRSRIGYVPGVAAHLWHGEIHHRGYDVRFQRVHEHGFDPATDIAIDREGCCWTWSSEKPEFHGWMAGFFKARREDG